MKKDFEAIINPSNNESMISGTIAGAHDVSFSVCLSQNPTQDVIQIEPLKISCPGNVQTLHLIFQDSTNLFFNLKTGNIPSAVSDSSKSMIESIFQKLP